MSEADDMAMSLRAPPIRSNSASLEGVYRKLRAQRAKAPAITATKVQATILAITPETCAETPTAALAAFELVAEAPAAEAAPALLPAAALALLKALAAVRVIEPKTELRSELLAPPLARIEEATERYEYAWLRCEARKEDMSGPRDALSRLPNCELM